jgi:radical SAM superfamily enzyme YgiQ (UPF0313 family)
MNILLLYPKFPEETFWNAARSGRLLLRRTADIPPLGLLTIARYLPDDFRLRLVDRNVREETEADWSWADVVFLSAMLAQRRDYETCVHSARAHGKPIAVGGPLTHAMPEELREHADWVCYGEAESVIDTLVADLRAGRRGRQYQGGNTTHMEQVRLPRFDLIEDPGDYSVMPIQFSRGCPFQCEFCDIIEIYGRVPRTKTPAQVLAELEALKRLGFTGYVFLVDDNFIGNKKKAKVMLRELAGWNQANGHPFAYLTEASINLADDQELLEAMSQAGLLRVFIGIETPDPRLLKTTLKMQNIPGNPLEKLGRIRAHGIHVTAGFIVGFDGEARGVFDAQRAFIQASGIGVAILGLLQALPGTQLSRRLEKEGRLLPKARVSANTTLEGINFLPRGEMTKREYLERYRRLVSEVYAPEAYFARILPALLALRRIPRRSIRSLLRSHPGVFLRQVYHLGLQMRGARWLFWKTLLSVLAKNPIAIEAFAHDCFYFHHLSRHARFVARELERYLEAPAPDDVLDQVMENTVPALAPAVEVAPGAGVLSPQPVTLAGLAPS